MKRIFTTCALAGLIGMFTGSANAGTSIVVDVNSGEVLQADKAFERWYPASLTKLMTAYIAFDAIRAGRLKTDSPVVISANAAKQPPSRMGYKPGNQLSLDNALKIMLVKSANDIAVAVGEAAGGANYPDAMNAAAAKLGMTGSHFANANGLHDQQNYTTARDLAILARALRTEFAEMSGYFGIEAITYGKSVETNYNILLGRFAGADGMKTGFVCASGFNLVASATREGRTLVAVVLGAMSQEQRAEKAANLLQAAFQGANATVGTLDSLQPEGPVADTAPDLRASVCTDAAAADRWDGRQVEGKITFDTPYITVMNRQPLTQKVGLLASASVTATLTLDSLARIPVPREKPVRPVPVTAAGTALKPTLPTTP